MLENEQLDKKSLRTVTKKNPDWQELAKDCVAFANAYGGRILIGIEDEDDLPPMDQYIKEDLPIKVVRNIQGRTINVSILPQIKTAQNDAQYLELIVQRTISSIASTSKGRYFIRIGDSCKPVMPDELSRLMVDKSAFSWEVLTTLKVKQDDYDPNKLKQFIRDIRNSDRISNFIKDKNPSELLDYYLFVKDGFLTNLGVLWIGKRQHRAMLAYAPSIQFIKKDENDRKVNKIVWDDFYLNPKELIQAVWEQVPDWKESIEIPDGIFRKNISNYDEVVIRELIANALAHRPYTIKGDIFVNLFPDRLEVHNPGLLPLGVTPSNILHKSNQRNTHLAKVFYDLKLMEREGSGYDRIFEVLLSAGKPIPEVIEGDDRVVVTVRKRIVNEAIINFIDKANREFQLRSKELISLGLIAQHTSLTAIEFSKILDLHKPNAIRNWLGRLIDLGLVKSKGKTKGKAYFIDPDLLKRLEFKGLTDLKEIPTHRLQELIIQDLSIYEKSSFGDIHKRIGKEIPARKLQATLNQMVTKKQIQKEGVKRWTNYSINKFL